MKLGDIDNYFKTVLKAAAGRLKAGVKKQINSLDNLKPLIAEIIAKNNDPQRGAESIVRAVKAELNRAADKLL